MDWRFPNKVKSVTNSSFKNLLFRSKTNEACNDFSYREYKYPKSPNSRVRLPTGIFWKGGGLGSSSLQATDRFLQFNGVTYDSQKFTGKQGSRVRWWGGPNLPFLSLHHWWRKSLTSELGGGDERAEQASPSRRALTSNFYATDDVNWKKDGVSPSHANETFDHTFLPRNYPCLIKICAYSHVAIIYTDGCRRLLNWSSVNKCFDSESYWFYIEIIKVFFSVQFTIIQRVYLCCCCFCFCFFQ